MKEALYTTAYATIACAKFPAGSCVSVKFSHQKDGVTWYEIAGTEHGPLDHPVMYPDHHLTNFVI